MNNILYIKIGPIRFSFLLEITNKPIAFPNKPIKIIIGCSKWFRKKSEADIFYSLLLFQFFSENLYFIE